MAYVLIEDFKYGMDRRRPRFAGLPGTLWLGENVHLSRGGDIERAKKFVPVHNLPAGTFGLSQVNGRLYVFGSGDLAATMPAGVQYQRLQSPSAAAMSRILDVKKFDNAIYAIAEYADGGRYHFYNGARVTAWDTLSAALASPALTYEALARKINGSGAATAEVVDTGVLLTASVAGTGYSLAATHVDGGSVNDQSVTITNLVANVAAVAGTASSVTITVNGGTFDPGVNTIESVLVGDTIGTAIDLIEAPVNYVLSDTATATALAAAINDRAGVHGYSAAAGGADVVVSASVGLGSSVNGRGAWTVATGDVSITSGLTFAGGVNAIAAAAQSDLVEFGGTFEAADVITVTVAGVAYIVTGLSAATAERAHVQDNRVYAIAGPGLYYSALNDATDWTLATASIGAGVIVASTDADGAQTLTGMSSYQGLIALFSDSTIIIYSLGTDDELFERVQELDNVGTIAGRAVTSYGASDLFYLDQTGIRSLQARDSSNAAFVSDAGTAFDPFVQEIVASLPPETVRQAVATISPQSGSYWLALGEYIMVLTNFPGTGIRGWTYYKPGFAVTDFARTESRVYCRDGSTIYLYGGRTGNEYPGAGELASLVRLPFVAARDEAGKKLVMGFDIGGENEWAVTILPNPNDETQTIDAGRFIDVTYHHENAELVGETSHIALDLVCDAAGPATISNLAVHHNGRLRA